jgi:hypothetical protein
MSGRVLTQAAEIIVTAAGQIKAMLEKLDEQLIKMLENSDNAVHDYSDDYYDKNEWLLSNTVYGYALKKKGKGKRKAYGQLGVHLVFYNETYSKNHGWEPTIFIFYAPGDDEFHLEDIDYILGSNFICALDNRMWRWWKEDEEKESTNAWMFAVPLVGINNEEDIKTKIVAPAKALLSDPENSMAALTCDKSFLRFQWTGETFSMSIFS